MSVLRGYRFRLPVTALGNGGKDSDRYERRGGEVGRGVWSCCGTYSCYYHGPWRFLKTISPSGVSIMFPAHARKLWNMKDVDVRYVEPLTPNSAVVKKGKDTFARITRQCFNQRRTLSNLPPSSTYEICRPVLTELAVKKIFPLSPEEDITSALIPLIRRPLKVPLFLSNIRGISKGVKNRNGTDQAPYKPHPCHSSHRC